MIRLCANKYLDICSNVQNKSNKIFFFKLKSQGKPSKVKVYRLKLDKVLLNQIMFKQILNKQISE